MLFGLATAVGGCGAGEDDGDPSPATANSSLATQPAATPPTTATASLLDSVTTRSGPVRGDILDAIESIPVAVANQRPCLDLAMDATMPPFELKLECNFNNNFEGIFNTLHYVRVGLDEVSETATGPCLASVEADAAQDGAGGFEATLEAHRATYVVGYDGVSETYQELERVAPLRVASLQAVVDSCG